jgi:hypothetical protein
VRRGVALIEKLGGIVVEMAFKVNLPLMWVAQRSRSKSVSRSIPTEFFGD